MVVTKTDCGVWMYDDGSGISVSRRVAMDVMRTLGLDPNDFRTRDKIITGISNTVDDVLDSVSEKSHARRS